MLYRDPLMHSSPYLRLQQLQLPVQPLTLRFALEGERLRSPLVVPCTSDGRQTPKLDQTGLLSMERQTKLRQPLWKIGQHPLCTGLALEAHHEVVGIADDGHTAPSGSPSPLMHPEIKHIVQKHIR